MRGPDCTDECDHPHPNPAQIPLDHAILAHRANPTPETHEAVMRLAEAKQESFFRTQAIEFIARTR